MLCRVLLSQQSCVHLILFKLTCDQKHRPQIGAATRCEQRPRRLLPVQSDLGATENAKSQHSSTHFCAFAFGAFHLAGFARDAVRGIWYFSRVSPIYAAQCAVVAERVWRESFHSSLVWCCQWRKHGGAPTRWTLSNDQRRVSTHTAFG